MANGAHLLENLLDGAIAPEPVQGLGLVLQQLGQFVRLLVWSGQREEEDRSSSTPSNTHTRTV
jgi:hypothetical protein